MALDPTEIWSEKEYSPFQSAARGFICPGYADESSAINAVFGRFGCTPGSRHPFNPNLYATNGVRATNKEGPTTWLVVVPYTYLVGSNAIGGDLEPLLRPTRYFIEPGTSLENVDLDAYGNLYTTTAGFPFDEQHVRPIKTLRITATRFYPNYDIGLALKYMNKVNSTAVQIKTLGTAQPGQMYTEFIGPTSEIVLTQFAPIEVKHIFEVRGPLVSGVDSDPSFRYRRLNAGKQGWYRDASGNYQPEDFSAPDPSRSSGTTGTYYRYCSAPTPLRPDGTPIDTNVRLGEGVNPKTPVPPPAGRRLETFPLGPEIKLIRSYYYLLFTDLNAIDFGPLLSGL